MLGKQIANYRIEAKLGEGGMGIVYRAIDVDLDRPVAIKVLSAQFSSDPALLERFRTEAKTQAHLNHPNIASLYTLLNVEGQVGIVMEYLEGETLEQILRKRGLIPWKEAAPWFNQALLGIGFAHRSGIIHRDIKPSNIMVTRSGIVKVMDFGIAKMVGGQRLTKTGAYVGTVAYMSPEQVRDDPVDVRSDIYCLGVTLYELLTAHLPFESGSEFQVMSDHLSTPPPSPSRYYPYIPPGVEQAILRALAKKPDARFQSVEEFAGALEHPEIIDEEIAPTVISSSGPAQSTPSPAAGSTLVTRPQVPVPIATPTPPIPLEQNPPAPSLPPLTGRNDKKLILSISVVLLVLLVSALAMILRLKSPVGGPPRLVKTTQAATSNSPISSTSQTQPVAAQDRSGTPRPGPPTPRNSQPSDNENNPHKTAAALVQNPNTVSRRAATIAASKPPRSSEPESISQSEPASASVDQAPASPTSSTQAATGPSQAELDSATEDLIKMRARIEAVHQSLANLKQQQAADGLSLRGDIVASESRLDSYYQMADRSLQQRNLAPAQKSMEEAEQELTKLEHFLGR